MNLHHANRGSGEQSGGLSTVSKNSGRIIAAIVGAIIIKPTRLAAVPARAANQRRWPWQHELRLSQEDWWRVAAAAAAITVVRPDDLTHFGYCV